MQQVLFVSRALNEFGPGWCILGYQYDGIKMQHVTYQCSFVNLSTVAAFMELQNAPGGPMGLLSNPQKLQELMSDPEVGTKFIIRLVIFSVICSL
jgi:hypothetical protein